MSLPRCGCVIVAKRITMKVSMGGLGGFLSHFICNLYQYIQQIVCNVNSGM
jgi:hypothetical protein